MCMCMCVCVCVCVCGCMFDTHCDQPGMTGYLYTDHSNKRVGRHWLQRRTDRDGPSPQLKEQRSVCVCQRIASAKGGQCFFFPSSWKEAACLHLLVAGVRNLPVKWQTGSSISPPPSHRQRAVVFLSGVSKWCSTPGHKWEGLMQVRRPEFIYVWGGENYWEIDASSCEIQISSLSKILLI